MVRITIKQDMDTALSPRDWEPIGRMVCLHKRYRLGDPHDYKEGQFNSWGDLKNHLIQEEGAAVMLPLYLYDHGGLALATTDFNDRWDSGQAGFTYMDQATLADEFGGDRDKATRALVDEVERYSSYLQGDVFLLEAAERSQADQRCPHCGEVVSSTVEWLPLESCTAYGPADRENLLKALLEEHPGAEVVEEE